MVLKGEDVIITDAKCLATYRVLEVTMWWHVVHTKKRFVPPPQKITKVGTLGYLKSSYLWPSQVLLVVLLPYKATMMMWHLVCLVVIYFSFEIEIEHKLPIPLILPHAFPTAQAVNHPEASSAHKVMRRVREHVEEPWLSHACWVGLLDLGGSCSPCWKPMLENSTKKRRFPKHRQSSILNFFSYRDLDLFQKKTAFAPQRCKYLWYLIDHNNAAWPPWSDVYVIYFKEDSFIWVPDFPILLLTYFHAKFLLPSWWFPSRNKKQYNMLFTDDIFSTPKTPIQIHWFMPFKFHSFHVLSISISIPGKLSQIRKQHYVLGSPKVFTSSPKSIGPGVEVIN